MLEQGSGAGLRRTPHLSLAQVHAALAYYFDHQAELDAEMERRRFRAQELREETEPPFTRKSLTDRLPQR